MAALASHEAVSIIHHPLIGNGREYLLATSLGGDIQSNDKHIGVTYLLAYGLLGESALETDIVPVAFVHMPRSRDLGIAVTKNYRPLGVALNDKVVGPLEHQHRKHTPSDLIDQGRIIERQSLLDIGERENVFSKLNNIHSKRSLRGGSVSPGAVF